MATHAHTTPERRPATAPNTTGRRSLLTALACMPVLGVPAVPDPDTGLIRLCTAFHEAHEASINAPDDTDEWEDHLDRRNEISDELEDMTPVTHAGKVAKLKVGLVMLEEQYSGGKHEDFVLAALEAAVHGGAA